MDRAARRGGPNALALADGGPGAAGTASTEEAVENGPLRLGDAPAERTPPGPLPEE